MRSISAIYVLVMSVVIGVAIACIPAPITSRPNAEELVVGLAEVVNQQQEQIRKLRRDVEDLIAMIKMLSASPTPAEPPLNKPSNSPKGSTPALTPVSRERVDSQVIAELQNLSHRIGRATVRIMHLERRVGALEHRDKPYSPK